MGGGGGTSCCHFKSTGGGGWHAGTCEQKLQNEGGEGGELRVVLWNLDKATIVVRIKHPELDQYKHTRVSCSAYTFMDCDEERMNLVLCGGCGVSVLTTPLTDVSHQDLGSDLQGGSSEANLRRGLSLAKPVRLSTEVSTKQTQNGHDYKGITLAKLRTSSRSTQQNAFNAFLGCGVFTLRNPEQPGTQSQRYCAWSQATHSTLSSTEHIFRLWVSSDLANPRVDHKLFAKQRVDGNIRGCCLFDNSDNTPMAITFGNDWCLRLWDLSKCEQPETEYLGENVCVKHPLVVMIGHTKPVVGCCVSYNKVNGRTWAISMSDDETARIWDLGRDDSTQFDQSGETIVHCARMCTIGHKLVCQCKCRDGCKCSVNVCVNSVQPSFRHGLVPVLVQGKLLDFSWALHSISLHRVLDSVAKWLRDTRSDLDARVKIGKNGGHSFREFLLVQAMSCAEHIVDTMHTRLADASAATTRLRMVMCLLKSCNAVKKQNQNNETTRAEYTIQVLEALARQTEVCQADDNSVSSNGATVFSWASVLILLSVRKRNVGSGRAALMRHLQGQKVSESGVNSFIAYSGREQVIQFRDPIKLSELDAKLQQEIKDQCFQSVTSIPMKKAGASKYCWVIPKTTKQYELGGFAYIFGEGNTSEDSIFFPCSGAEAITAGYESTQSFPDKLVPLRIIQENLHKQIEVQVDKGTWSLHTESGTKLSGAISAVYKITLDQLDRHLACIPAEATHFVWAYQRSDAQTMSGNTFQNFGGFVYGKDGMTNILAVNALGLSTASPSLLTSAVRSASWIGHLLCSGPDCEIEMAFGDQSYKHLLVKQYLDAMTVLQSKLDADISFQRSAMKTNELGILLPARGLVNLFRDFPDLMCQYMQHLPLCNIRRHHVGSAWSWVVYDNPNNPDRNPDRMSVSASDNFWGVLGDGATGWKYIVDGKLDRYNSQGNSPEGNLDENLLVSSRRQHFVVPLTGTVQGATNTDPFIDLLRKVVKLAQDDLHIFQHPQVFRGKAVQAIVKYKWESGSKVKYYRLMVAYALHFICFMGLALADEDQISLMTRKVNSRSRSQLMQPLYWIMWVVCCMCWVVCCVVFLHVQMQDIKESVRKCQKLCRFANSPISRSCAICAKTRSLRTCLSVGTSICSIQTNGRYLRAGLRFMKYLLLSMWIPLLLTPYALMTMHLSHDNKRMHDVDTLEAVTLMYMALNSAYFLRGWDDTAFLMNMLRRILTDMIPFTLVLVMLLGLFTSVFYLLLRDSDVGYEWDMGVAPQFHSVYDAAISVTNMALGDVDIEYFRHAPYGRLATGVYLVFMFILPIVMLNSLIAIMSHSFEQVKEERQERRVFERAILILELHKMSIPEFSCASLGSGDTGHDFIHVLTGDTSSGNQLYLASEQQRSQETADMQALHLMGRRLKAQQEELQKARMEIAEVLKGVNILTGQKSGSRML
eukprot:COSAG01_NODE_3324_length_6254_cov_10.119090_2_plen_1440_part_00